MTNTQKLKAVAELANSKKMIEMLNEQGEKVYCMKQEFTKANQPDPDSVRKTMDF